MSRRTRRLKSKRAKRPSWKLRLIGSTRESKSALEVMKISRFFLAGESPDNILQPVGPGTGWHWVNPEPLKWQAGTLLLILRKHSDGIYSVLAPDGAVYAMTRDALRRHTRGMS